MNDAQLITFYDKMSYYRSSGFVIEEVIIKFGLSSVYVQIEGFDKKDIYNRINFTIQSTGVIAEMRRKHLG